MTMNNSTNHSTANNVAENISQFGIGFNAVNGNAQLVVVSLNFDGFKTVEQRSKVIEYVRKITQHIDKPVAIVDRNVGIQGMTEQELADIGLQRIEGWDG